MNAEILARNRASLEYRNVPYNGDLRFSSPGRYVRVVESRTGAKVPLFEDGSAAHSIYDPVREARQIAQTLDGSSFVFFAGIGAGYHIREFLRENPRASCAIAESDDASFALLLGEIDISDILIDRRVTVFPNCEDPSIARLLPSVYLPSLHGGFSLYALRSWKDRNVAALQSLNNHISGALRRISADFSVQSHFGKLWLRNCMINIGIAGGIRGAIPKIPTHKTAIIAAAGPGLEPMIPELLKRRSEYSVFSTDTAFSALIASSIKPDFFVSIDAQAVSASHAVPSFYPELTVILDLCGNPDIALKAKRDRANLLFAAGGHPLAGYASSFSYLPPIETHSGTVTVAALDAAKSLGFSKILLPGADFSYVSGKPYCRGTYLDRVYGGSSYRLSPAENSYCALIFRTPVTKTEDARGIHYSSEVLNAYALACRSHEGQYHWKPGIVPTYPSARFFSTFVKELEGQIRAGDGKSPAIKAMLPFLAWFRARASERGDKSIDPQVAFQLALDLIARYTKVS